MANKYLTSFNTLAEYEAASLELPNVSLIKSTGEIKYKNILTSVNIITEGLIVYQKYKNL